MTPQDWEALAEAELTHDAALAAHEVSLLTPSERSTPAQSDDPPGRLA